MTLTPFESALMLHFVGDWLLQNQWMAVNKVSLTHPASWIHGAIHGILLGLILGPLAGLVLALLHMLVDTRRPIRFWIRAFKRCESSPELPQILIWCDQVLHIGCIAAWIAIAGNWK